jgi:NAD(P)-dependent dehydrogenase (short-subunit alcohol dehydrogenase family)
MLDRERTIVVAMNNSTALVTGANKGIGLHIAGQLAEAGLTVWLGSRDRARGEKAAAGLAGRHGAARVVVVDVTDQASIDAAADRVGDLDVLVNNAGIIAGGGRPDETDAEEFLRTYDTNVFGVVRVTNAFLPALRRSARPRIVNVSSGTASLTRSARAEGSGAAYRSSKAALNALTIFYAQSLGEPFKVNALAPGLRKTDLNARAAASDGDPAEAAAGAVTLALLPEDGPTGRFLSWDAVTEVPW